MGTTILEASLAGKFDLLKNIFGTMGEVVVAMSGGVDSVLLAKVAYDTLGKRAIAVTADSPSLPRRELYETVEISKQIGIHHMIIETNELDNSHYVENPIDRCYFCKNELFDQLDTIKSRSGIKWVAFGENIDDQSDHRPGSTAASEHGVRAPLREAGLNKEEIRSLAQFLKLPNWDKPASACLASRIPYGETVTSEKLAQIEKAEDFLWELGIRGFRVRHHGEIARLEVPKEYTLRVMDLAEKIVKELKGYGFRFVTLDLAGYQRGSFNEGLIQINPELMK